MTPTDKNQRPSVWDDPRMPWGGTPTKQDKRAWWAIVGLGIYGIAMMPLRPIILGMSTYALATITGSAIAMVDIGAGIGLGIEPTWWLWLGIAALSIIKFDWIFWWAGRLWGHGMIEMIAGKSRWAARTARYAEALARRFGILAVFLVGLVPFLPAAVVYAFVGMAGMRLRTFLIVDFLSAIVNRSLWMFLGYKVGEPAKELVDVIDRYSLYIALGIVVLIFINSIRGARKEAQEARAKRATTSTESTESTDASETPTPNAASTATSNEQPTSPNTAAEDETAHSPAGERASRDGDHGIEHR